MNIQKSRVAVAAFFFINGFFHANFMARLPQFQSQLGISDSVLGALLLLVALGALVGMPLTGRFSVRFGSDRVGYVASLFFCLFLTLAPLAWNVWLAGFLFFWMGLSLGTMDVSMNGQAVLLERLFHRPIMASFHAVFSIGMATGAGVGALFSAFHTRLSIHIGLMALLCLGIILWASQHLIRENSGKPPAAKEANSGFTFPNKAIVPLGFIAFCCMTGEGAMADWSAIYMSKVVGQGASFSAITFGVYATGMTLGRVFGDSLTARLGRRQLMIYDALLATTGLGMALAYVSPLTTLVGFFMVGLGVSTIVPIVFSTAGNTQGVNPSVGIAMATSIGYTGFFIGPPVIGFLSDGYGLRVGLGFSFLLFCVMFVLVLQFIKRDGKHRSSMVSDGS